MAVNYNETVKNNRLTQVVNAIDAGASPGYIEICTAAYASVLAQVTLNDPCGTVATGVLTFDVDPVPEDSSANNTGTAAIARIKDSDGTVVCDGLTVGTGSENIVLNTTTINAGDIVQITSASITHG